MKKIPFPGRRQHMEQEPGKLLLIHAKLHSQHRTVFLSVFHPYSHCTYFTFTHTEHIHTHPPSFSNNLYPLFLTSSSYTLCIHRNTLISCITSSSASICECVVPISSNGPPYYVINPGLSGSNSSCFCCGIVTFRITMYLACT